MNEPKEIENELSSLREVIAKLQAEKEELREQILRLETVIATLAQ